MSSFLSKTGIACLTLMSGLTMPSHAAPREAMNILELSHEFTDSTIVFPQSIEANTQTMLENWYLQNYVDLDREADKSADTELSDEEIVKRLASMPTVIEMPFNSIVRTYIDMYTQRRRQLIQNMLGMSLYYMPIFEEALEKEGLPLELKYLPIIESALNPNAVSRSGATGLWQFMITTAKGLGLEVNSIVDERRDPYRSSESAAKYLKQLYSIYEDWSLAIAAYNCGPGNVNKALKRLGDADGKKHDFWEIYPFLPNETRGYVPGFIAANYVMTYYPEHGISPALAKRPLITDSIHVTERVHFRQIADVLNVPVEEIKILNPQFRKDYIPGDVKPYALILPSKQIFSYLASRDSIVSHDNALYARRLRVEPSTGELTNVKEDGNYLVTEKTQWHKVARGETMTSIARKYGITVASLKSANGGIRSVKRGQNIKIVTTTREKKSDDLLASENTSGTEAAATDTETANNDEALMAHAGGPSAKEVSTTTTTETTTATSKKNTAASTAKKSATTAAKNNSSSTAKPKTTSANSSASTYTVKKGDSLYKIAQRHGTTVDKIMQLNGLTSNKLQIGDKLKIK